MAQFASAQTLPLVQSSFALVRKTSPIGFDFWFTPDSKARIQEVPLQDHADIVYTAHLLGAADALRAQAAAEFHTLLATAKLYGRPNGQALVENGPNAHLTAYLLGAARLLQAADKGVMPAALFQGWELSQLISAQHLPLWPRAWTHHIWRVSHWIGGIPSILLQIAESGCNPQITRDVVDRVLQSASEKIIDPRTGLLRPYKSEFLQKLFRSAYRLRHNPEIGDLGGVVHLLWVFHATGRTYIGDAALFDNARKQLQAEPFMEKAPYCLDFDIVQLARTCKAAESEARSALVDRATRFRKDIAEFLTGEIPGGYTLHKLPGALATMHESAIIEGLAQVPEVGIAPVDIIRDAFWI
ncbi:hypothetical protein [Sphingobium yanoikuyae]|uniref:hypothetical protein n=1 Tax=Sphingobium yanoikuyae TaxID=13690 RepID=UPI00293C5378|nr:hypothetical protein [Sphingobium yanoikuyae]MDV3482256.1 hypothetical protein [Sphingobium yanoikuyae]